MAYEGMQHDDAAATPAIATPAGPAPAPESQPTASHSIFNGPSLTLGTADSLPSELATSAAGSNMPSTAYALPPTHGRYDHKQQNFQPEPQLQASSSGNHTVGVPWAS